MIIKSFLPNPEGSDREGELFTLYNDTNTAVNLSGWSLKDGSGKNYSLYGQIQARQELSFPAGSSFTLNNNGETLYLFSPSGQLVDELGYIGSAASGRLIQKHSEINQELKEELFDPLALASSAQIIQPSSVFNFALLSVLSISVIAFILHKKWPKSEREVISEKYARKDSFF